jgi:hypothetical protein
MNLLFRESTTKLEISQSVETHSVCKNLAISTKCGSLFSEKNGTKTGGGVKDMYDLQRTKNLKLAQIAPYFTDLQLDSWASLSGKIKVLDQRSIQ